MMYTRNVMLAVIAATSTLVNGITNGTGIARGPTTTSTPVLDACPTTCGAVTKLCTDDAIIKGTSTHLTYLCPETKTVLVTETVFVTVHEGENQSSATSSATISEDITTTVVTMSKSTIFITKTVKFKSKHPTASVTVTSSSVQSSLTTNPASSVMTTSLLDSSTLSATGYVVESSTTLGTSSTPIVIPESATVKNVSSTSTTVNAGTLSVNTTVTSKSSLPLFATRPTVTNSRFLLTNPYYRPSVHSSGIWLNATNTDVATHTSSGTAVSPTTIIETWVPLSSIVPVPVASSGAVNFTITFGTPTASISVSLSSIVPVPVASSGAVNFSITLGNPTAPTSDHGILTVATSSQSTVNTSEPLVTGSPAEFTNTFGNDPILVNPNPTPIPGRPPVGHPDPAAQFTAAVSTSRTSLTDMEQFPSVTDDGYNTRFISLAVDTEIFTSVFGEATSTTADPASPSSISTDATSFSSEIPPYPTAPLAARNHNGNFTSVDGTISKVLQTTTVSLQDTTSQDASASTHKATSTSTTKVETATAAYPGATTETLPGKNSAGDVSPGFIFMVLFLLFMNALFN